MAVLFLALLLLGNPLPTLTQDSSLVFISKTGTLTSRVFCREVVQCVGAGNDVFWSFFGLGSVRLTNTSTRFVTTSTMVVNGTNIITANLTFDPLVAGHASIYVCQVVGPVPASTNIRVVVQGAPVVILSNIPDYDLSQYTIGDTITVSCQVETCLSDVTVTFYKESQVLRTTTINNNNQMTLVFSYTLIVSADSAGEYACRAVTSEGGAPNEVFSLTGTPKSSSTSTTMSSTSSIPSSSTSSSSSIANTATIGATVSTTATSSAVATSTPSPSTSVPPSSGGASTLLVEWTLFLSLLLVTIFSLAI